MMSWIAWIHDLVGAFDSDEVTVQDYFLVWFISSWFGEDRFYDTIGDLVQQLSGSFLTLIYLLSICRY